MRYIVFLGILMVLFSRSLSASPKTDSIVTFLGGAHAQFVWPRFAWCNDNYTPKTKAAAMAEGLSLMLMDTRTGTERAVMTGLKEAGEPRISRSGKWATVVEGKKSYIVDLTASTPVKKVLLDAATTPAYYLANAWWIDPATGDEYVFATDFVVDKGSTAIWKFKVSADGTAGPATKVKVNSTEYIVGGISISADGKKLGAAFPWPNTKILDIPSGNLTDRHFGVFGCQPNLAPDNSYRFFHCEGDHFGLIMFGSNLQDNAWWFVNLSINLAGVPNPNNATAMDFMAPRWTNHVQYYTAQCPMGDNYRSECADPLGNTCYLNWSLTATQVKSMNMLEVPKFFIGKFTADFKLQEKSMMIGADPRYMQYTGDAWICSGVTDGKPCPTTASSKAIRTDNAFSARIQRTGSSVTIHTSSGASSVIRVSDARGKVVRTWSGSGTCTLDAQNLSAGAYMVSVAAGARSETVRLLLTAQ